MKQGKLLKDNIKIIIVMILIIVLGLFGITYALKVGPFKNIGVNTTTTPIAANITYDSSSNTSSVVSTNKMLPIEDSTVTTAGANITDDRVVKVKFKVSGVDSNPKNTIYDVALRDTDIDCDLRTKDLKWQLYKDGTLLSEGNFSPTFDTMENGRMVLTPTQQSLTTTETEYTFLLWISEACTGDDLSACTSSQDQSKYLGKHLSTNIKIEASTEATKDLVRQTGEEGICTYTRTDIPTCNTLTYNGSTQALVSPGSAYKIENGDGKNVGDYAVTVSLNGDNYKWSDDTTEDKVLKCSIAPKSVTITASDQSVVYGTDISSEVDKISITGLATGDTLSSIHLSTDTNKVGTGTITPSSPVITNSGEDVTNNYSFTFATGTLSISCNNSATAPTITNSAYTGTEITGVSGGKNIDLSGVTTAVEIGDYKAYATPKDNYCWSDYSTAKKEYSWSIGSSKPTATIADKTVTYTGSEVTTNTATVTTPDGGTIPSSSITYSYYSGASCSGTALNSKPVNAGSYSVKAKVAAYGNYSATESNCASITIIKATPNLKLSISGQSISASDSLSSTYGKSLAVTYSYTGTGTASCSSSSTSIATCSVNTSAKTVTITPISIGNASITVNVSETPNYKSETTTRTMTVTCSPTATEPTVTNKKYTGSTQVGISGGTNVTLSGTLSATAVGNYTGYATPKTNYCWSDSTTTRKTYSWAITDGTAPTITLASNSDSTYTKTKSVTVKLRDTQSGLMYPADLSIKYGWSTSRTTAPTSYTTVPTLSYVEGTTSEVSFTAYGSGLTGSYYLWVVPVSLEDQAGNANTTNTISTGTFKFDNTAPTISNYFVAANLLPSYGGVDRTNQITLGNTDYYINKGYITATTTGADPYMIFSGMGTLSTVKKAIISVTPNTSVSSFPLQVFYATSGTSFSEANSATTTVSLTANTESVIEVTLPGGNYTSLRFDLGTTSGVTYKINYIDIVCNNNSSPGIGSSKYIYASFSDSHSKLNSYQIAGDVWNSTSTAPTSGWVTTTINGTTTYKMNRILSPDYSNSDSSAGVVGDRIWVKDGAGNTSSQAVSISPEVNFYVENNTTGTKLYYDNFREAWFDGNYIKVLNDNYTYGQPSGAGTGHNTNEIDMNGKTLNIYKGFSINNVSLKLTGSGTLNLCRNCSNQETAGIKSTGTGGITVASGISMNSASLITLELHDSTTLTSSGNITNNNSVAVWVYGGNININGGTINAKYYGISKGPSSTGNSTIKVTGGTLITNGNTSSAPVFCGNNTSSTCNVTISGGTFRSSGNAVSFQDTNSTYTITGGVFEALGTASAVQNSGTLTLGSGNSTSSAKRITIASYNGYAVANNSGTTNYNVGTYCYTGKSSSLSVPQPVYNNGTFNLRGGRLHHSNSANSAFYNTSGHSITVTGSFATQNTSTSYSFSNGTQSITTSKYSYRKS